MNLAKNYIHSEIFLTDLAEKFGYKNIIIEQDTKLTRAGSANIVALDAGFYGVAQVNSYDYESIKNQKSVIILSNVSTNYILPLWSQLENLDLIHCGTGLASVIDMKSYDGNDVGATLSYGIDVFEPFDKASFYQILTYPQKKYIRLTDFDFTEKLTESQVDSVYFTNKDLGISGNDATILVLGGISGHGIRAAQKLLDSGTSIDCFASSQYGNLEKIEGLKESIKNSKKLFVVSDLGRDFGASNRLQANLRTLGIGDCVVSRIRPKTEQISTVLPEYLHEVVSFDDQHIFSRIEQLL